MGGPNWKSERQLPLNTPDLKETTKKIKKKKKTKKTDEHNEEKYLQILDIHYIQTRGFAGLSPW